MATLTFLGTGTSDGIPQLGCDCPVCSSTDPKDKRLRTSALIEVENKKIIIDAGFDFRQQALRHHISALDAILFTHSHADHSEGIAELRPLSRAKDTVIPCYACSTTVKELRKRFDYIFNPLQVGGGLPQITLNEIDGPFTLFGREIIPIPILHGKLPIFGYRLGDMAFITDASFIPDSSFVLLEGVNTLVLNALRPKPHPTHFGINQAVEAAQRTTAQQTYFVHIAHKITHHEFVKQVPKNMAPAYDGLSIQFNW